MPRRVRILDPMPSAQAELYQQILTDAGLDVEVVPGHIPGLGAQLLVLEDHVPLVEVALSEAVQNAEKPRMCAACGEFSPSTFLYCWSCGASMEAERTTDQHWEPEPEPAPAGSRAAVVAVSAALLVLGVVVALVLGA